MSEFDLQGYMSDAILRIMSKAYTNLEMKRVMKL